MGANMSSGVLTTGQLSLRPGYPSEWTLSRWRTENIGPPFQRIGGRVFYAVADVEAWERARRGGGGEMPFHRKKGRKPQVLTGTEDDTAQAAA